MLPVSTALTLNRQGISVGFVAAANFVSRAPAPTSVYICAGHRGPPTRRGLGAPDQGADLRTCWAVGPTRRRST